MESTFVDEIKKKSSLVKFVVNTDTATDIISYLYKETERQKSEIDILKQKLTEMNNNINSIGNQDKFDQISERINELSNQMDKKIEESSDQINNHVKEKVNDINSRIDSLTKRVVMGDNFFQPPLNDDIYNQLNFLRTELQALRANTSEFLGVDEKELIKLGTSRSNNSGGHPNSDSESVGNTIASPRSVRSSGCPPLPISQTDSSPIKKERMSLQGIADQIAQLKEEINQIKEANIKSNTISSSSSTSSNNNTNTNNTNNKISSRVSSRIKKKETFSKEKKEKPKNEINETAGQNQDLRADSDQNFQPEKIAKSEEITKSNENFSTKIEDLTSLYQEIAKLKQKVNDQTNQLKKIESTTKTDQISLDDYVQEILQSAMKCDSESQKLTNDYKNLQNLLINSLQEIKERMDSMSDQFNEMATKEEVMAAFSEVINPKTPQNGTCIGVTKCKYKCLACGRTKPSVISTTDSNLAEILHYHPLANRSNETFRPGAKVTVLNKEIPVTSRSSNVPKDVMSARRPKSSRS